MNSFKFDLDYHQTFGKHNVLAAAGMELNQGNVQNNWNINYGVLYDLGYHSYYLPDAIQRLYEQGKDYYTIRNKVNNNLASSPAPAIPMTTATPSTLCCASTPATASVLRAMSAGSLRGMWS